MRFNKFNEEVYFSNDEIVRVRRRDIELLKEKAENNKRKRVRLCSHKDVRDNLHEMLIIHMRDTYIRPHKHLHKSESLYVIEGKADAIIFDETGNIAEVIQMGDYRSGRRFYYRIPNPAYHALLISTKFFVFHETTSGPFKKSDTIFAPWAPEESDGGKVREFTKKMIKDIKTFVSLNEESARRPL